MSRVPKMGVRNKQVRDNLGPQNVNLKLIPAGAQVPVTQGLGRTSRKTTRAALSAHPRQAGRYMLSQKALSKHLESL